MSVIIIVCPKCKGTELTHNKGKLRCPKCKYTLKEEDYPKKKD